MADLKFGTSGLRGLVTDLLGAPARAYTAAFLDHLGIGGFGASGRPDGILVGQDLRASSAEIAACCFAAIHSRSVRALDCGLVPTPALALAAARTGLPAIMVTGSHIPDDRNGLKFYRPGGAEIDKADEAGILDALSGSTPDEASSLDDLSDTSVAAFDALTPYRQRYLDAFAPDALAGLTVGVYQHSGVARDLLVDCFAALGARAVPLGRSDQFVPVDTEAHRPEDVEALRDWAGRERYDAIVSTDGDADRPLIADADGAILRGDLIGLLAARALDLSTIVTPVTSGSVVDRCEGIDRVIRTKVGSPFVIAGMEGEIAARAEVRIAGFEANGGFLLGSATSLGRGDLAPLMTRDALLPILAVLSQIRERATPLAQLVAELRPGAVTGHRLRDVLAAQSKPFLSRLRDDRAFRDGYFAPVGTVVDVAAQDGVKLSLDTGATLHYRASGNAPELRLYVEAPDAAMAADLLDWGVARAQYELDRSVEA